MGDLKDLDSIFATVLELSPEEITEDLSPESCPRWDSLNHLRLVTEIEGSFGVQFTMAEVQSALSLRKFRELIEAHAA
jgi:acyl carrier protein